MVRFVLCFALCPEVQKNLRKENKMRKVVTVFFLVIVMLVIVPQLKAFYWVNDIIPPFTEGKSAAIEKFVISGASLYFKANSDIMTFYAEAEIPGDVEYNMSRGLALIQSAIKYLKESKKQLFQAAQLGISAGYEESRRSILKNFHFDRFSIEKGMNETIKNRVKAYLENGDVTGFYLDAAEQLEGLLLILVDMERCLQSNTRPPLTVSWSLLQKLSELTLFGNYATCMARSAFGN
jgi:hypothetical protein